MAPNPSYFFNRREEILIGVVEAEGRTEDPKRRKGDCGKGGQGIPWRMPTMD